VTATGPGDDVASEMETSRLETGELVLLGRIMPASNATFLGEVNGVQVVYKPVAGERPLWDFPSGTLAQREVAAYLVSQSTDWDVVPATILRSGPHGLGMVQRWQEPDPGQAAVDLVPAGSSPAGWRYVFGGSDGEDRPVWLIHEESEPLRRMAVFDVLVNNADRKGGHVLAMPNSHRFGVDHGLTFHCDPKLRTVLWGWQGEELTTEERSGITRVLTAVEGKLGTALAELLDAHEVTALGDRCRRLLGTGKLPRPAGGYPAIPWPPF
jgi:uncharacterized repeat protein (TIGR03843 family)